MRRRIVALVALGTWLAGALAGCGTGVDRPAGQTVVTFAYPYYLTAFNQADYQKLADAFNQQNPDLHVELREISSEEMRALWEKGTDYVDLLFDPESGVDAFVSRAFRQYVDSDRLLALDPLLSAHPELDLDDFYPLDLDQLRGGGALRGLLAEIDLAVLYYNKDLFDQAGVAYPAQAWTRDDLLAAAVALRQGLSEREVAFGGQVDEVVPFVYAHGGQLRGGDGYTLTDPRTVEAVRWYADLALADGVMPLPAQWEAYQPEPGEGTISITTVGGEGAPEAERRWGSIGAMAELAAQEGDVALWSGLLSERQGTGGWDWDFEWGIAPWPRDQVEIIIPYAFAYFMPASTPQPEAALRWIDYLSRQPPQLKGIPGRRSVAESEAVRQAFGRDVGAEAYGACLAALETATPVDYSLYAVAELYLGQALLDILEGGLDVETALAQAQAALEPGP